MLSTLREFATPEPAPSLRRAGHLGPEATILGLHAALFLILGATAPATAESPCLSPPPVRALTIDGFYADRRASIPDPARFERHQRALQPLRDFRDVIARSGDAWLARRVQPSACAISNLRAWVAAQALTTPSATNEAVYEKTRFLFAAAVSVGHLSPTLPAGLSNDAKDWLRMLAQRNRDEFARAHRPEDELYLWTGAMSAAVFRLTGDAASYAYARQALAYADRVIAANGDFAPALARGQRAAMYHLSAADAIIFMQALTARGSQPPALTARQRRMVARTIEHVEHPELLAPLAQARQEAIEPRAVTPICALLPSAAVCSPGIEAGYLFGGDPRLWIKPAKR